MTHRRLQYAALLLSVTLAACGSKTAPDAAAPAAGKPGGPAAGGPPPGMPVEGAVVTVSPLAREIIAVGSLRSDESVVLRSEIAGRIVKINFQEGQAVAKGQVLFELDDSVVRAEFEQARATFSLAKRNSDRAVELLQQHLVSVAERDATRANLDIAQAALSLAQAHEDKTRIAAPFAGIAGLRMVSPGAYVAVGQDLVNVEAMNPVKLDFRLAEVALSAVKTGQKLNIDVDAYPGQRFAGEIYAIDPRVADATRSIGVRARIDNADGRLKPGLFARVRLQIANKGDAIQIPEQAIFPQGEQQFVYVIEDGKANLRPVTIGLRTTGLAEIVAGLKPGEVVITAGLQKIGPGSPVMAVNLAAPASAPAPGQP
jgi:membrane fusion protein (multidrug efflux system)